MRTALGFFIRAAGELRADNLVDFFLTCGAAAIVRGVWMMSEAWGWVALGIFGLLAGLLVAMRGR